LKIDYRTASDWSNIELKGLGSVIASEKEVKTGEGLSEVLISMDSALAIHDQKAWTRRGGTLPRSRLRA
jgi:hypothetical protein